MCYTVGPCWLCFIYSSVHVCLVLKYNWPTTVLAPGTQHSDLILLYVTKWLLHNNSSYHLSPYKHITLLLIVCLTLYIHIHDSYFVAGSLCLLIFLTHLSHSLPSLPSGNHRLFFVSMTLFVLLSVCICFAFRFQFYI